MRIKIISEIKLGKIVEKKGDTLPGPLLPTPCSGSGSGEPPRRTEKKRKIYNQLFFFTKFSTSLQYSGSGAS